MLTDFKILSATDLIVNFWQSSNSIPQTSHYLVKCLCSKITMT